MRKVRTKIAEAVPIGDLVGRKVKCEDEGIGMWGSRVRPIRSQLDSNLFELGAGDYVVVLDGVLYGAGTTGAAHSLLNHGTSSPYVASTSLAERKLVLVG